MKEEMLLRYLMANCAGRGNIKTRACLARALHVSENELSRLVVGASCAQSLPPAGKAPPLRCPPSPHADPCAGCRRGPRCLRVRGVPVASSRKGCFYALNAAEIVATIRILEAMIRGLERAVKGLTAALERFTEQPAEIFDGDE